MTLCATAMRLTKGRVQLGGRSGQRRDGNGHLIFLEGRGKGGIGWRIAGFDKLDFGTLRHLCRFGLGGDAEAGFAEFASSPNGGARVVRGLGDVGEVFPDGDSLRFGESVVHPFAGSRQFVVGFASGVGTHATVRHGKLL